MSIKTLSIKGTDSRDVARQAREALADFQTKLMLFFASIDYDLITREDESVMRTIIEFLDKIL